MVNNHWSLAGTVGRASTRRGPPKSPLLSVAPNDAAYIVRSALLPEEADRVLSRARSRTPRRFETRPLRERPTPRTATGRTKAGAIPARRAGRSLPAVCTITEFPPLPPLPHPGGSRRAPTATSGSPSEQRARSVRSTRRPTPSPSSPSLPPVPVRYGSRRAPTATSGSPRPRPARSGRSTRRPTPSPSSLRPRPVPRPSASRRAPTATSGSPRSGRQQDR